MVIAHSTATPQVSPVPPQPPARCEVPNTGRVLTEPCLSDEGHREDAEDDRIEDAEYGAEPRGGPHPEAPGERDDHRAQRRPRPPQILGRRRPPVQGARLREAEPEREQRGEQTADQRRHHGQRRTAARERRT
ncbi:hypothetical protein [Streptomyces sp. NPDC006971]|uniref:hypothetical protein n=1 Tax=Streptomyces sp. NPDC006971 TaxID=3154784 RepID=UPI0033D5C1D5